MSRVVLNDLLRGELGFSGIVVSDALDMAGVGLAGQGWAAVAALKPAAIYSVSGPKTAMIS